MVVSNPCFEVWLYFHYKSEFDEEAISCKELKNEIAKFEEFGYNRFEFIKRFKIAIENAEKADSDPNHFMPKVKEIKLYKLGKAILNKVSMNDFDEFIDKKIPRLIEQEKEKVRFKGKNKKRR